MPSHISRGKSRAALGISALATVLLALSQPACERLRKVEGASPRVAGEEAAQAGQASLFTVSADQQAHLKVVPVTTDEMVHYDPHHRHGGLGRGPHHAGDHAGERADFADPGGHRSEGERRAIRCSTSPARMSPTRFRPTARRAIARHWPSGCWIATRNCWTRGALAGKDLESSEADYNDAATDVAEQLAGAADLRHHPGRRSSRRSSRASRSARNWRCARRSPAWWCRSWSRRDS